MKKPKNGFTLVELLVVIAIIGVLASVVLVSLSAARMKARDTRRKEDMHQLATAILLYKDTNNEAVPINSNTITGDWDEAFKTQMTPHMSQLPVDPLRNNNVRYYGAAFMTWAPDATCNNHYVIWAYLENPDDKEWGAHSCGFLPEHYFIVIP